jgi:hypothetical protein
METNKEVLMRAFTITMFLALTFSGAALAQNASDTSKSKALEQNASPNGAGGAAKQSGAANTESGPAKNSGNGATPKMQGDTGAKK